MQTPPIPCDESQRLRELYSYDVLDTATEQVLDDIVQTAASICGTAFGALTLVDRNRQWFKAKCGFSLKETVRNLSVCGHGILSRAFFEVSDTDADVRFQDNELLKTLGVRFYGGTQLIGAQGHALGMLCVLDPEPKHLSPAQQSQLATLAIRAMDVLETHRQRRRMQWLGALVNQVEDEIYLFDLSTHHLLHANQAALQNGLADVNEIALEHITPELPHSELAAIMALLEGGQTEVTYESEVQRPQGRVWVEARWQRMKAPGQLLVMCTLRDITKRERRGHQALSQPRPAEVPPG